MALNHSTEQDLAQVSNSPVAPFPDSDSPYSHRLNQAVQGAAVVEDSERKSAFDKIYSENLWADGESKSGPGSTVVYTARVRQLIDYTVRRFHLKYMVDAPSGDCNWQTKLETFPELSYTGVDIVGAAVLANGGKHRNFLNARFLNLDLVEDVLPPGDFYLVRDCVQHLSFEDGVKIFQNVEASGAKYLITNFHVKRGTGQAVPNVDIGPTGYFPVTVLARPYSFPEPLYYILDDVSVSGNPSGDVKLVGVWKLPVLGMGTGEPFVVDIEQAKNLVFLSN